MREQVSSLAPPEASPRPETSFVGLWPLIPCCLVMVASGLAAALFCDLSSFRSPALTSLLTITVILLTGLPTLYFTLIRRMQCELLEKVRVSDAFRQIQDEYQRLVQVSPDGIVITDITGEIVFVSPRMAQMLGLPAGMNPAGMPIFQWIAPEEHERVKLNIEGSVNVLKPGAPQTYRLLKNDRTLFWGEMTSTPVVDGKGQAKGLMCICRDVTERRQAEEKMREQAALLDVTQDAVFVCDLHGQVLFWNNAAELLYGCDAATVVGQRAADLLYEPGFLSEARQARERALAEGEWRGVLHQITRKREQVVVEARLTLVRDSDGKPKSILFVNTDVTEKNLMEQKFLRAQRLESIGTLAAGIAHDLNNILAPVILASQMLLTKSKDENETRLLATILQSAKRGAGVVRQVLTFGRGVDGQQVPVQPKHLIREMLRITQETFPRNIIIRSTVARDLWIVPGDATQLHQVVMNLCVNARDAMSGGGTLLLAAENIVLPAPSGHVFGNVGTGPHVMIQVTDTGHGIPETLVDKIFDPFFTTKDCGKGTGLGLSTVLGIVRSHHGFLSVESVIGKGTTFKVYLPALTREDIDSVPAVAVALERGNGEEILVVDDEESIREVTRKTLASHGYQVSTAAHGQEALKVVAQLDGKLKAVVTDIVMPVMDGIALVRALKQSHPQIKVISCTGLGEKDMETRARNAGADSFLEKPFTPEVLLAELHRHLKTPGNNC